jgi:uncharacterized membrane protein
MPAAPKSPPAVAAILAALALQGCQSAAGIVDPPPARAPLQAHAWHCADSTRLVTRNRPQAIELRSGPTVDTLIQTPAASGVRYANAAMSFWSKGREAVLERPPGQSIACHEIRAQSLLEDARIRGLDFRGTGNEPGWLIEIGPGNTAYFEDRYGSVRLAFPDLQRLDADSGTAYAGRSGVHRLRVLLKQQRCADSMSDDTFPVTVELDIDGERRRGCGTLLR